jgi:hypothetical protein
MSEEGGALRKRLKGKPVEFNRDSLKSVRSAMRRTSGGLQQMSGKPVR